MSLDDPWTKRDMLHLVIACYVAIAAGFLIGWLVWG